MPSARGYTCPVCGGVVPDQARTCQYCRSPLATLRCANCYHLNSHEALHCSGCGRDLGLAPVGEPGDLLCPACECVLERFRIGPGSLWDCSRCGGQFVEHALLQHFLDEPRASGLAIPRTRQSVPLGPVRYLPCPTCGDLMNRKNFGHTSGVVVDVCSLHGLWFDQGELARILSFVRSGGLRTTAARQLARTEQPRTASNPDHSGVTGFTQSLLTELVDAAADLLSFVTSALRGLHK